MKRRFWTEPELDELARRYPHEMTEFIAADMDRKIESVYYAAGKLKLKKTKEFLASKESTQFKKGHEPTQFKPGFTPWNKGKPGSTGNHPNTVRTQFKAGRPPQDSRNYRPVGSVRINRDGYLERKVSDDSTLYPARRWIAVHRLVWEAQNGPIPKGHIVVFRQGMRTTDPDLITIDRVELISRAENMSRNTLHNLPPELKQLISMRASLVRAINKRERHEVQD